MTSAFATPPQDFRARVVMTRADHASGTDRVAEAASASNAQIIVNIQGDEPLIDPAAIDAAVLGLLDHDEDARWARSRNASSARTKSPIPTSSKWSPIAQDNAIYFSRSPIPYRARSDGEPTAYFKHIGLYVYRRDFLLAIPTCRSGRWNTPSGWSNCAPSKTASRFAWWKPNMNRSASTRPRIGRGRGTFRKTDGDGVR